MLIELGLPGGRTGCRDLAQGLALARAAHASPALRLVGFSTYEGLWARDDDTADSAWVGSLMATLQALAQAADAEGLLAQADEVLLTAGGSALFDLVLPGLRAALSRPVRALLRSGCYVTHDDGHYQRLVQGVDRRLAARPHPSQPQPATACPGTGLQGALEVWASVQSLPEPGLALLGAGKRDVSFDMGLPRPLHWAPASHTQPQPAPADWQITALNDQHAYLRWPTEGGGAPAPLAIGDRVGLGISHPCTTFDKWRWMPIVDAHYRVVDAITTLF